MKAHTYKYRRTIFFTMASPEHLWITPQDKYLGEMGETLGRWLLKRYY